jgi:hypothetical protein
VKIDNPSVEDRLPPIFLRGDLVRYIFASGILISFASYAYASDPLDVSHAKLYFQEAQKVTDKEGGKIWGKKLYGPILLVDYETRAIIANQKDAKGLLHKNGDCFEGKLPKEVEISNTPTEWSGTRWTMMIWQTIPADRFTREKMFAHELFHRIQNDLKLNPPDKLNLHLDSLEGRIWLQVEWRALASALMSDGAAQEQAVRDVILFRDHRQKMFSEASENERSLEIAEGVPEYTGLAASSPDVSAARWNTIARLTTPDLTISFVRSFAYTSGPAYGLLLDQRLPKWRSGFTAQSDLGKLISSTTKPRTQSADERAKIYGISAIRVAEEDRAKKIELTKMQYRERLVNGQTMTLPGSEKMRYSFNPSTVVTLDSFGAVYPTFRATAPWGTLEVTDGALLAKDFSKVTVSAPTKTSGQHLEGKGWTLELSPGWAMGPTANSRNFTVLKK